MSLTVSSRYLTLAKGDLGRLAQLGTKGRTAIRMEHSQDHIAWQCQGIRDITSHQHLFDPFDDGSSSTPLGGLCLPEDVSTCDPWQSTGRLCLTRSECHRRLTFQLAILRTLPSHSIDPVLSKLSMMVMQRTKNGKTDVVISIVAQ